MITSPRNASVQRARKLQKRGLRDRAGKFLVEGASGIREAIMGGPGIEGLFVESPPPPRIREVIDLAGRCGAPVLDVSPAVMRLISDATTPPGAIAIAPFVDVDSASLLEGPLSLTVVLAGVRDPGNVGTILRTAWAVGVDAVFLGEGTADVYNPKVVRATAGAIFSVPFARDVSILWLLDELGMRGVRRVAADPRAAAVYDEIEMSEPCSLVFGNEASGIPQELAPSVDERACIPMSGKAESLNVGIAAALFLFEAARQRRRLQ